MPAQLPVADGPAPDARVVLPPAASKPAKVERTAAVAPARPALEPVAEPTPDAAPRAGHAQARCRARPTGQDTARVDVRDRGAVAAKVEPRVTPPTGRPSRSPRSPRVSKRRLPTGADSAARRRRCRQARTARQGRSVDVGLLDARRCRARRYRERRGRHPLDADALPHRLLAARRQRRPRRVAVGGRAGLERAFQSLKSQDLRFDSCTMTVTGARAQAACKGRAVYVPRIGDQSPRFTSREWSFELRKADQHWTIASARSS